MTQAQFTAIAEADLGEIAYFIARDDPKQPCLNFGFGRGKLIFP
jgi:hypothetical protein|tara:strand:- start:6935 stop:7066 length:132 start_codon:yes stop_codon:yes gene_type:complete